MALSTNLKGWLNKINPLIYSCISQKKEGRSAEHLNFQNNPLGPIRALYCLSIHSHCYKEAKENADCVFFVLREVTMRGFTIYCLTQLPSHINHTTLLSYHIWLFCFVPFVSCLSHPLLCRKFALNFSSRLQSWRLTSQLRCLLIKLNRASETLVRACSEEQRCQNWDSRQVQCRRKTFSASAVCCPSHRAS